MARTFNLSGNNYIRGGALVHFNRLLDDGTYEGHRFIGNVTGFEVTKNPEIVKHKSFTTAIRRTDFSMTAGIEEMISFTVDNFSLINWAMHSFGEVQRITEALQDGVTDTIEKPLANRGYILGQAPGKPFGDRDVSFLAGKEPVVKQGATVLVRGVDYQFNRNNRIFFRKTDGGAFVEGTPATVTYSKLGDTYQFSASGEEAFTGELTFDPVNASGVELPIIFPSVYIYPNGATQLLGGEFNSMAFQAEVMAEGEGFPSFYTRTGSKIPFNAIS